MATLQVSVAAGDDDAEEADDGSGFSRSGTTLTPVSSSTDFFRNNIGLRFTNVTIPKDSAIVSATLDIEVVEAAGDDMHVDILAEAVANAANFLATADVTSRGRTVASAVWEADNVGQGTETSPDFAAVMQEVIAHADWASGNAVVIFLDGLTAPELSACVMAPFEHATGAPAQLTVEYNPPADVGTIAAHGGNVQRLPDRVAGY